MYDKEFDIEIDGHTFTGLCDYEAAQTQTDIDPPIAAMVTVGKLYMNGGPLECYAVINPATIHRIEAYLVEQYS
jgi:hypothetical protein